MLRVCMELGVYPSEYLNRPRLEQAFIEAALAEHYQRSQSDML